MSDKKNENNEEQNSWWVYDGTEKSEEEEKTVDKRFATVLKNVPKWRDKSEENRNHNAEAFIPLSDELLNAVNSAIYLRRPLLVTGDPGIGKSSLAKSIAHRLLKTEPLVWQITSKSVLQDALYSYDALARLHVIQMKKLYHELKENDKEVEAYGKISTGIENYLKLKTLGTAFCSKEKPMVVLIDEIDKSDIDLPNDLLHIFEEQAFEIDELKRMKFEEGKEPKIEDVFCNPQEIKDGKVICQHFPIIIMTSNGEREFPPAFLRRCISVEMKLDESREKQIEQLSQMVTAHFGAEGMGDDIEKIIESFVNEKGSDKLLANDQLLNAIHLVLNSSMDYEAFRQECEPILLRALDV